MNWLLVLLAAGGLLATPPSPAPPPVAPTTTTTVAPTTTTTTKPAGKSGSALVSWYAAGTTTANGEHYNPDGLTFANRSLTFGTKVKFCANGKCVVARCNDRGPSIKTRLFDLSRGTFAAIAPLSAGVTRVTWEIVS